MWHRCIPGCSQFSPRPVSHHCLHLILRRTSRMNGQVVPELFFTLTSCRSKLKGRKVWRVFFGHWIFIQSLLKKTLPFRQKVFQFIWAFFLPLKFLGWSKIYPNGNEEDFIRSTRKKSNSVWRRWMEVDEQLMFPTGASFQVITFNLRMFGSQLTGVNF